MHQLSPETHTVVFFKNNCHYLSTFKEIRQYLEHTIRYTQRLSRENFERVASNCKDWALTYCNMKAHMEEVEDDLAAEEENKLINEVRRVLLFYSLSITTQQSVALLQEYKTW